MIRSGYMRLHVYITDISITKHDTNHISITKHDANDISITKHDANDISITKHDTNHYYNNYWCYNKLL